MFLKKLAQITPTDENIPGNSFQCQRFGKMFLNILAGLADMRIDAYGRNVGTMIVMADFAGNTNQIAVGVLGVCLRKVLVAYLAE